MHLLVSIYAWPIRYMQRTAFHPFVLKEYYTDLSEAERGFDNPITTKGGKIREKKQTEKRNQATDMPCEWNCKVESSQLLMSHKTSITNFCQNQLCTGLFHSFVDQTRKWNMYAP